MNPMSRLFAGLFLAATLAACSAAPKSSSTVNSEAAAEPAWAGKVVVSPAALPANVEHKVIGTVNAESTFGYAGVETLYPTLAEEARKMGANGVINVIGGRKVTFTSWSAAHASGTAVKVENPADLDSLGGKSL